MKRTFLIMMWVVMATIFFGTMAIVVSFLDSTGRLPHKVAAVWAQSILLASRIRVKVRGLSRINSGRSYIFMPNHQSNFDIPVLLAYLPVQFRWIAKAELFKIPLFGEAMKRAGYISIDRSNWRSAVASLKRAAETIRNGASVIIFPEGTRSLDGQVHGFKKGGFVLATDARVPVVPVLIRGTYYIMPKSRLMITPQNVTVDIAPPIDTTKYTRKNKEALMQRVREEISKASVRDFGTC